MWVRQEYKPDKMRFERPFKIEANRVDEDTGDAHDEVVIDLEQSYRALGTTVWDGSIALAKLFDCDTVFLRSELRRSRVLELGAGCGLVGIYLSLLGAKHVTLTDLECCVPTLEKNVEKNISPARRDCVAVMEHKWGESTQALLAPGPYDLVVAAEVLYDEEDSKKLAQSIILTTHEQSRIFVSLGRNRLGKENFVKAMTSGGYTVSEVTKKEQHPKYQDYIITILQVTPCRDSTSQDNSI